MPDQIQLLGDPDQGPNVADSARAHGARGTQIRDRRGLCRSQHDLACDRAAADGIPNRLGRDAVAMTVYRSFKYMHVLSCIDLSISSQA